MPKPYVITYRIDDSQAQAAFQRSMANAKASEGAWNRAGSANEKSWSRRRSQIDQEGSATEKMLAKAAKMRQRDTEVQAQRMDRISAREDALFAKRVKAIDRESASKVKAAEKSAASQAKASQRSIDAEDKRLAAVEKAFYKNEASIQRVKDQAFMRDWRRGNQRQVQIEKESQKAASQEAARKVAAEREHEREIARIRKRGRVINETGQSQMSWLERAAKVHLAFMALRGAGSVVDMGFEANRAMRAKGEEFGQASFAAMGENRALASVMGVRNDERLAQSQAAFNVETGMGTGAGQKFRETFRGRAQSVAGVNLSNSEFEKFEKQSAALIASKGLDPGLAGDIAGAIVKAKDFKRAGQGAKEALAETANVLAILDAHAGRLQELAPNFAATVATLVDETGGVLKTAQEAAVGLSVMAEFKPAEGEVFERRGFAAIRDFKDKKKARFFKMSGITGKTEGLEHFDRAIKAIDEEMKTTGVKVDEAIANLGFKEQREVIALKTLYNSRDKVFAHAKKMMDAITVEGAQKLLEEAKKGLDFQMRAATAKVEEARIRAGEREMPLAVGMAEAEAQLIDQDIYRTWSGTIKQWTAAWRGGFLNYKPTEAGQKGLQEEMALSKLSKDLGVPTQKEMVQSHIVSLLPESLKKDRLIGPSVVGITNALSGIAATLIIDPAKDAKRLNELKTVNSILSGIITSAIQDMGKPNKPRAAIPANVAPQAGAVRGP